MEQNKNIAEVVLVWESFSAFYEAEIAEETKSLLAEWLKQCKESRLLPFSKLAEYFSLKILMSTGFIPKMREAYL